MSNVFKSWLHSPSSIFYGSFLCPPLLGAGAAPHEFYGPGYSVYDEFCDGNAVTAGAKWGWSGRAIVGEGW